MRDAVGVTEFRIVEIGGREALSDVHIIGTVGGEPIVGGGKFSELENVVAELAKTGEGRLPQTNIF